MGGGSMLRRVRNCRFIIIIIIIIITYKYLNNDDIDWQIKNIGIYDVTFYCTALADVHLSS